MAWESAGLRIRRENQRGEETFRLNGKIGKMYVNYSETDLDELYNTIQTISACVCPSNTPNIPEQSTGFAITIKYDSNAQMQIYIAINKNIYIRNSNSEWTKL